MAEIKIRRKPRVGRWPLLLLLLIPVAWYVRQRAIERHAASSAVVGDTGTVPAPVPLPPEAITRMPTDTASAARDTNAPARTASPARNALPAGKPAPKRP